VKGKSLNSKGIEESAILTLLLTGSVSGVTGIGPTILRSSQIAWFSSGPSKKRK